MSSYKSGQVSAQLFANSLSSQQNGLASLFSPKPAKVISKKDGEVKAASFSASKPGVKSKKAGNEKKQTNLSTPKPNTVKSKRTGKEKKQAHLLASNPDVNSKKTEENKPPPQPENKQKRRTPEWSAPFVHESLQQGKTEKQKSSGKPGQKRKAEQKKNDENEEEVGKRPRRDRIRDKQNDGRTVYVGNCPLSADKKVLKSLFREFGEIESIRFRCAPPADPNLPRRAIVITKNFHEQCKNYVAYIVFKEEADAKKALVRNGHVLDGLHLRVDISTMSKKHDKKRSIFVGNLPFDVTEEDLWSHFEDCGEIKNVRLVRDRQTFLGKGIGYVQFDSKDSVSLALKLNKTKLQGREVRVMVCTNKPEKTDKKSATKKEDSEKKSKPKPKKPVFGPSNSTTSTFKAKLMLKKEKRLRKIKKKKENAKKALESGAGPLVPKPKKKTNKPKGAPGKKGKPMMKKSPGQKGKKAGMSKGKGKAGGKQFKSKDRNYKKKS